MNAVTPRAKAPPIWLIALSSASSVMGLALLTPALPIIRNEFGASSTAVQYLLTVYLLFLAVGQLIYGTVSDHIGRRLVMLFGALLFALGGISAIWANSLELLIFFRVIQGFGAAACMAMARAVINDCFERTEAARQLSLVAVLLATVPILSFAFGGMLAQLAGWQGAMLMIFVAGLTLFVTALFKLPETHLNRTSAVFSLSTVADAYSTVLKNKIFFAFAMVAGMQVGMFFAMSGFLPYQYERMGYSASEFGLWFALTPVFYLIGNTINRHYLVSRGLERAAFWGTVLTLVSVVAMFGTQVGTPVHALSLALPCCLFGFGNGIVLANATVGAMSAAGHHAGTGTGIAGAWQMATGGIAGTIIVALGGAENILIGVSGLILMSVIAVYYMYKIMLQTKSVIVPN